MGYFKDERGEIEDLFDEIDSVTKIRTVEGAVRGNHLHKETTQWTYLVSGCLIMYHGDTHSVLNPGVTEETPPGQPHAWLALEESVCLVFTKGPRSGEDYESDTYRLEKPLV